MPRFPTKLVSLKTVQYIQRYGAVNIGVGFSAPNQRGVLEIFKRFMSFLNGRNNASTSRARNFLNIGSILTRKNPLDSWESGLCNGFFRVKIDPILRKSRPLEVEALFRPFKKLMNLLRTSKTPRWFYLKVCRKNPTPLFHRFVLLRDVWCSCCGACSPVDVVLSQIHVSR